MTHVAERQETVFEVPSIVDWTLLPASCVALAWTDESFRSRLIENPTRVLQERVARWPRDKTFVVVEDTPRVRHFVLPARKRSLDGSSRSDVLETLMTELGDDRTLEFHLPAEAIANAFFDPAFKDELFRNPVGVLRSLGLEPPAEDVVVLENSEYTYHLVLPTNPAHPEDLSFEALDAILREKFGQGTTKCCASGTCD